MRDILITAITPIIWGTTYIIATEFLPADRPLLTATLRALPIGLLLILVHRQLPRGIWWLKIAVLGALNIGFFFALLFLAAYRLPGGVAATLGAIQPLIVTLVAIPLLGEVFSRQKILSGIGGIIGVALLVLGPAARLDAVGIIAGLSGAMMMATGTILTKRWGRPAPLLVFTAWQLVAGGLILLPLTFLFEGLPPELSTTNIGGYIYLGLINTGLAYAIWFRGIEKLPASAVSFLALLSPVTAVMVDFIVLQKTLSFTQLVGVGLIIISIVTVQRFKNHRQQPSISVNHGLATALHRH